MTGWGSNAHHGLYRKMRARGAVLDDLPVDEKEGVEVFLSCMDAPSHSNSGRDFATSEDEFLGHRNELWVWLVYGKGKL